MLPLTLQAKRYYPFWSSPHVSSAITWNIYGELLCKLQASDFNLFLPTLFLCGIAYYKLFTRAYIFSWTYLYPNCVPTPLTPASILTSASLTGIMYTKTLKLKDQNGNTRRKMSWAVLGIMEILWGMMMPKCMYEHSERHSLAKCDVINK